MHSELSLTVGQLAAFQGKPCYQVIQEHYLAALQREDWRSLVVTLHTMKSPKSYYRYPAVANWDYQESPGSGAHHKHFGGLALHTLQNLQYAESWAQVYERRGIRINKDLLYATILIHDCMKRFIYQFDETYGFIKNEDSFIAKQEDHHSWILRELAQRGCDRELILSVAAIHGIDDVSLATGVTGFAVVNHYLAIGETGLSYTAQDIRPEHVIAFLADSDWHWSGQAQAKAGLVAEKIAAGPGQIANYLQVVLGSCFSYEAVGHYVERFGVDAAVEHYQTKLHAVCTGH